MASVPGLHMLIVGTEEGGGGGISFAEREQNATSSWTVEGRKNFAFKQLLAQSLRTLSQTHNGS